MFPFETHRYYSVTLESSHHGPLMKVAHTIEEDSPRERVVRLLGDTPELTAFANSIFDRLENNQPVDLPEEFLHLGLDWTRLIKTIRHAYGCGIEEAQVKALSNRKWLRWCKQRVLVDRSCFKQFRNTARHGRLPGWVGLRDGKPVFLR